MTTLFASKRSGKKFSVITPKGKIVHFGAKGCGDFEIWGRRRGRVFAERKRKGYIARHKVITDGSGVLAYKNPEMPAYYAMRALWDFPRGNPLFKQVKSIRNRGR